MDKYKALPIRDNVFWVGALDPDLAIFDIVMNTRGTSYNSYLIKDEKITLVDGVKDGFLDQLLDRLADCQVKPEDIDYIVVNHTEPDHSGAIGKLLTMAPKAQVIASQAAHVYLKEIINADYQKIVVKHNETISIGANTLRFISAPFLHWPDSMFTYLEDRGVIFTCDGFGSHYYDEAMFSDLVGDFTEEFKYYYETIMSPFNNKVREALEKIKDLKLEVICPSHGPIIRNDLEKYIGLYQKWSHEDTKEKATVFLGYVSAYGNTAQLAQYIKEGIEKEGILVDYVDLANIEEDDLSIKLNNASAIVIGTPTLNKNTVPPVWKALASICAIRSRGKMGAVFGSYGWSGEAIKLVEDNLKNLGLSIGVPSLKEKFIPSKEAIEKAREYGKTIVEGLK